MSGIHAVETVGREQDVRPVYTSSNDSKVGSIFTKDDDKKLPKNVNIGHLLMNGGSAAAYMQ